MVRVMSGTGVFRDNRWGQTGRRMKALGLRNYRQGKRRYVGGGYSISTAGQIGAAVWALTVWATGRLGAGTNGRRRFGAGRFGAGLQTQVKLPLNKNE